MPRTRTRLGDRSYFAVAGPQIWNSLPADLRLVDNYARFRRLLRTYVWLRLRRLVTVVFERRVQIYLLAYLLTSTPQILIIIMIITTQTDQEPVLIQTNRRKWSWLGHTL